MTSERIELVPAFTLALWMSCLGVGIGGHLLRYDRPVAPTRPPAPVAAQFIHVTLGNVAVPRGPIVPAVTAAPQDVPPPPMAVLNPSHEPPAFVEPVRVALPAAPPVATTTSAPSGPAVRQLTYGMGEGAQPAPDYPREAALAGEEGVVVVRFSVDENGNVTSAEAVGPCKWPILNQAAARSIRQTWNFGAGPLRTYQISITYQLNRH